MFILRKRYKHIGVEASNFTKEKLKNATKIELEFDNNSDRTDKYNRYLAWIWIDGELLQNLLVKEGLAKIAYLYGDYKYIDVLKESQNIAKEQKLGMWKDEIAIKYNEDEEFIEEEFEMSNKQIENEQQDINYTKEIIGIIVIIIMGALIKVIKKKIK